MKRCPITYDVISSGDYSTRGLRLLSPKLKSLAPLPFTPEEQRLEAARRAGKMSIQGVQPKLSAKLNAVQGVFEIVDKGGRYILKPPSDIYPELPANEDVTMRLAGAADIEVPLHGMVYARDGSLTYFVKRFDRSGHRDKLAVEDFAQLNGETRETKYNSSMERVAATLDAFCTFPAVEKAKLFRRTIFSFLTGNEDMHLKNFSLIRRNDIIELTPAYDLLNTSIALGNPAEEMALPLRGKKRQLHREDLVEYFGQERLGLPEKLVGDLLKRMSGVQDEWRRLIEASFLSAVMKKAYRELMAERRLRLHL